MSELAEALQAALDTNSGESDDVTHTDDGVRVQMVGKGASEEAVIGPGYLTYAKVLSHRLFVSIRKGYRRHAGEDLPATGEEYVARTMDEMVNLLTMPISRAVAEGVMVGQENTFQVRKAKKSENWGALFSSKSFKKESELYALEIAADPEVYEIITRDLRDAVEGISQGSGYHRCDQTDERFLRKIWDLWALAANSVAIGHYRAGCIVGAQWRERDILAGISAASEGSDDS